MPNSTQSLKSWSPLNKVAGFLVRLYQATFAHFLGGRCRFYPSCSHYAIEAFENFSFLKATSLVFKRLSSCHPFSRKAFYDPVPQALKEMSLS